MRRAGIGVLLVAGFAPALAPGAAAQLTDTYLDAEAAPLHRAASAHWADLDASVVRYTALIRQRIAAQIRAPLKDRTLYRNESAARVFWDRDYDPVVQVLGTRSHYPGREIAIREGDLDLLDDLTIESAFDPGGDRLIFGLTDPDDVTEADDEFWIAHPLAPGADTLYQYRSGDTLLLRLPDGRELRAVQLDVLPRVADVHRLTGSLWIDPESGALVRAVYRLSDRFDAMRDVAELEEQEAEGNFKYVPGLFKPWTLDLTMVAVDYSLWDFEVWLPRAMRLEGEARAGILKFPVSFDLSYRIESVVTESDLEELAAAVPVTEEVHFETRAEAMAYLAELASRNGVEFRPAEGRGGRYLAPTTRDELENSAELPPPIWDDAVGFQSAEQLEELFATLADLPHPRIQGIPWAANWGFQRPDLMRYNRVEGPAIGGRFQARLGSFMGPLSFEATGFLGLADLEPKVRLSLDRESLRRRVALAGYRDITAFDPRGRHLGFGNSTNALLFGRDDGEYFLATGADLTVTPPSASRAGWSVRLYAERQEAMRVKTHFAFTHAFDGDWRFRPNRPADELDEAGAEIGWSPWWGTDPLGAQFGMDLTLHGAAVRDRATDESTDWARARLVLRSAIPLAEGSWRVGLEAGAGTSWGDLPLQRHWILGGPLTLRGYPATSLIGTTFGRVRTEVARVFPAWTVSVFGDGGWAGERRAYDPDDVHWGVGIGTSLLDGLIRLDLSRGLTGSLGETRLDLYLDAIL